MTEVNQYVQTCLADHGISPWRRARMAADQITAVVLAEEGLPEDQQLTVPLEWEHRIPVDTTPSITTLDPDRNSYAVLAAVDEPLLNPVQPIIYGSAKDPAVYGSVMKEAFDALFDGDEAAAQAKVDEYFKDAE